MDRGFDLVSKSVSTCPGCGLEIVIRHALEVLGKKTIIVIPPGCAALFSGLGNETTFLIPGFQCNLENTAAVAGGIRAGLDAQGIEDVNVLGFAGDGATVDIGLQSLSGMIERNEQVIYICYDNEAYMNTGIQSSGSTPLNAVTTTTPQGKKTSRKNMLKIVEGHQIPYLASASVGYIKDFRDKVHKAKMIKGCSYIHVHTPCPTGWGFHSSHTIEVAKKAVQSGIWELYEVINGVKTMNKTILNKSPENEYFKLQKRFKKSDSN
jgi:pyruvate ferredoxin oxidoreductase beta subunit